jgi:quinol monooxygenase YgiN
MIMSTLRIVAPPAKRNEVVRTLNSLLGPTRVQPGCVNCRVYSEIEDKNVLILLEEWSSQADLDRHLGSNDYKKVLALMDMSNTQPEIKFNTVSDTKGIEAIEVAREKWEAADKN